MVVEAEADLRISRYLLAGGAASRIERNEPHGCHSHDVPVTVSVTAPRKLGIDRNNLGTTARVRDELFGSPLRGDERSGRSQSEISVADVHDDRAEADVPPIHEPLGGHVELW